MKPAIIAWSEIFTEDAHRVFHGGCLPLLKDTMKDMYQCAFLYGTAGSYNNGKPGEKCTYDYESTSLQEREFITAVYEHMNGIFDVLNGYNFLVEGISKADSDKLRYEYKALLQATTPRNDMKDLLECLERMAMVCIIERPHQGGYAPGSKERDIYYAYTLMRDLLTGFLV